MDTCINRDLYIICNKLSRHFLLKKNERRSFDKMLEF